MKKEKGLEDHNLRKVMGNGVWIGEGNGSTNRKVVWSERLSPPVLVAQH